MRNQTLLILNMFHHFYAYATNILLLIMPFLHYAALFFIPPYSAWSRLAVRKPFLSCLCLNSPYQSTRQTLHVHPAQHTRALKSHAVPSFPSSENIIFTLLNPSHCFSPFLPLCRCLPGLVLPNAFWSELLR